VSVSRLVAPCYLLLVGALLTQNAHADEGPLELAWHVPPSCPSETAVRRQVDALVATAEAPSTSAQPLVAEATVTETDGEFRLDLLLRDGELMGRRTFTGTTCAEVTGAAAVAIALLLRPQPTPEAEEEREGGAAEESPAVESGAAKDATPVEPPSTTPSTEESPARARRLRLVLSAPTLEVGLGLLSVPSVGLGAGIGLELRRWRLGLLGLWHPEVELAVPGSQAAVARARRVTVRSTGCRWFATTQLEFAPCAILALEHLSAEASGDDLTSSPASAAWLALGVSALLRLRLAPSVTLVGQTGLSVQTSRPILVVDGLGRVEQIGPLELTLGVGAEWIF